MQFDVRAWRPWEQILGTAKVQLDNTVGDRNLIDQLEFYGDTAILPLAKLSAFMTTQRLDPRNETRRLMCDRTSPRRFQAILRRATECVLRLSRKASNALAISSLASGVPRHEWDS